MIKEVALFVTDIGAAAVARQRGSQIARTVPRSLVPTADRALGLGGQLESYLAGHSLQFENVPEMSDAEWKQFVDERFPGQTWSRWFGKTPSAIYSVVVVESTTDPTSPTDGGPGESQHASCPRCGRAMGKTAVLCIHCGLDLRTGEAIRTEVAEPSPQVTERSDILSLWQHRWSKLALLGVLLAGGVGAIGLHFGRDELTWGLRLAAGVLVFMFPIAYLGLWGVLSSRKSTTTTSTSGRDVGVGILQALIGGWLGIGVGAALGSGEAPQGGLTLSWRKRPSLLLALIVSLAMLNIAFWVALPLPTD